MPIATGAAPSLGTGDAEVEEIVARRAVTPLFQRLVHLSSGETVGFECLARGPEGSSLRAPGTLFAAAARAGLLGELDWACRAAALGAARRAALHPSLTWMVNVDPASLHQPCPTDLRPVISAARTRLRVLTELTARGAGERPGELLQATADARQSFWGVALDDVGRAPEPLALLPFLQPDVVKLDLGLLRNRTVIEAAAVANAVRAYAEATGAVILAEGIEGTEDLEWARDLGATYGQGFHYGHPGPLPEGLAPPRHPFPFSQRFEIDPSLTPFQTLSASRPIRRAGRRRLTAISRQLEAQVLASGDAPVVLTSFERPEAYTPDVQQRLELVTSRAAITVVAGTGIADRVQGPVSAAELTLDDPAGREWAVVVVGPNFAAALAATRYDGALPGLTYDYVLTYDRPAVIAAGRALLQRVTRPRARVTESLTLESRSSVVPAPIGDHRTGE